MMCLSAQEQWGRGQGEELSVGSGGVGRAMFLTHRSWRIGLAGLGLHQASCGAPRSAPATFAEAFKPREVKFIQITEKQGKKVGVELQRAKTQW